MTTIVGAKSEMFAQPKQELLYTLEERAQQPKLLDTSKIILIFVVLELIRLRLLIGQKCNK